MSKLWTVGRIADEAGVALHKVEYIIKARGIPFASRAGRLRIYDVETVNRIIAELKWEDAKRG